MGQVTLILGQVELLPTCPSHQAKGTYPKTDLTYPKTNRSCPKNALTCPINIY